jgi:hypothetical protein
LGVLRPLDKAGMMPEIFDDLAEVHRAPGVSDDDAPTGETTTENPS